MSKMTELTNKSKKAMERTDKFIKKVQPCFFIFTRQEKISGSNAISCVQELRTFN